MGEAPEAGSGLLELAPGVRVPEGTLRFSFGPSRGPGGQNVNRRSTRAELRVTIGDLGLPPAVASRLRKLAGARVAGDDELIIVRQEHRSQARNRAACLDALRELIVGARVVPKKRRPTRPSRAAKERRLEDKRKRSQTKQRRQPPEG